jgi:hypothetical protein
MLSGETAIHATEGRGQGGEGRGGIAGRIIGLPPLVERPQHIAVSAVEDSSSRLPVALGSTLSTVGVVGVAHATGTSFGLNNEAVTGDGHRLRVPRLGSPASHHSTRSQ